MAKGLILTIVAMPKTHVHRIYASRLTEIKSYNGFNVVGIGCSFIRGEFHLQRYECVLRYTKGIDMWSLGCILGEMLLGKPLFPGSSTINQVERIMATLPPPTDEGNPSWSCSFGRKESRKERGRYVYRREGEDDSRFFPTIFSDLISVSAGYGTNLLEKTPNGPRRALKDLLPEVSERALDLIGNLIVFNPTQRLTAVEALEHPYVAE